MSWKWVETELKTQLKTELQLSWNWVKTEQNPSKTLLKLLVIFHSENRSISINILIILWFKLQSQLLVRFKANSEPILDRQKAYFCYIFILSSLRRCVSVLMALTSFWCINFHQSLCVFNDCCSSKALNTIKNKSELKKAPKCLGKKSLVHCECINFYA